MKQRKSGRKTQPSRSVLNALALLDVLGSGRKPKPLAELARQCKLPKATALRYLVAFEESGYATKDSMTGGYLLGTMVMDLSRRFYDQFETLSIARDHLDVLAAQTGETSHLAILHVPFVVYIDMVEGPQRVRAFINRGERLPAYCVASGRAILAHSRSEDIEAVIAAGMEQHTKRTITTRSGLLRELQRTAERGYGVAAGQWRDDVVGISAPLFSLGQVVGAIGIACPTSRINQKHIEEKGELVRALAERISSLAPAARVTNANGREFHDNA